MVSIIIILVVFCSYFCLLTFPLFLFKVSYNLFFIYVSAASTFMSFSLDIMSQQRELKWSGRITTQP